MVLCKKSGPAYSSRSRVRGHWVFGSWRLNTKSKPETIGIHVLSMLTSLLRWPSGSPSSSVQMFPSKLLFVGLCAMFHSIFMHEVVRNVSKQASTLASRQACRQASKQARKQANKGRGEVENIMHALATSRYQAANKAYPGLNS